jgi:hypothetical protein
MAGGYYSNEPLGCKGKFRVHVTAYVDSRAKMTRDSTRDVDLSSTCVAGYHWIASTCSPALIRAQTVTGVAAILVARVFRQYGSIEEW